MYLGRSISVEGRFPTFSSALTVSTVNNVTQIAAKKHTYVTMEFGADEFTANRRKVRKGTHSCRECRRRKVKCIYATPDNASCIVCERRGAQCISQCDSPALGDAVDKTGRARAKAKANVDDRLLAGDPEANDADLTHAHEPRAPLASFQISESAAVSISSVHWSTKVGRKLVESCHARG